MRWIKGLLITIAVIVVALVAIGFFLPDKAHVERSTTIARPPSEVFTVLNSFRRFNDWSPWADIDPNAKYTYSGPASGVGAKEAWTGNKDIGTGSQEILESKPNELIRLALDFGEMGKAEAAFHLTPVPTGTQVTWGLDVDAGGKLIGRFFNLAMDSMVGKDYDKGLAKLKALVESFPAADISGVAGEEVQRTAQKIYYVSASCAGDAESAKAVLTDAYMKIGSFMKSNGVNMAGAPLTITTSFDTNGWKFDAAIPVDRNDVAELGDVRAGNTYAGKAEQFIHVGPYDKIGETTQKAYAWLAVMGYKPTDRMIEEYISDPGNTPPEQLQTRLVIPVQ